MTDERRPEDLSYDPPGTVGSAMPPVSADRPEGRPLDERGDPDEPSGGPDGTVEGATGLMTHAGGPPGEDSGRSGGAGR